MSEMVERIVGILSEGDTEADLEEYAKRARLVIEAMREPTVAMVQVAITKHGYLPGGSFFWADLWNEQIDAALK